MEEALCSKCKKMKNASKDFYLNQGKRITTCKSCAVAYSTEWLRQAAERVHRIKELHDNKLSPSSVKKNED